MNRVVITPGRAGAHSSGERAYDKASTPRERRCFKNTPVDLSPKQESMRKRHRAMWGGKEFTDFLNPLRRYLIKQVGRPWNDVWSEVCENFRGNGLQANHVKDHVKDLVGGIPHSGKTYFDDKDWFDSEGSFYWKPVWVDEKGILRRSKERQYPNRRDGVYHYCRESDDVEYHKLNGCWFRVEIGTREEVQVSAGYFSVHHTWFDRYHVLKKRALSKKEAKKLNLDNKTERVAPKVSLEKKKKGH